MLNAPLTDSGAAASGGAAPKKRGARRKRDADQTRGNIIEAAMAEFADKGLAGARVDEIARQTETSKHMIYYYFTSKEGLYRAALEHTYQNFRVAEQAIDYAALPPLAALESLVGLSFDFHVANPLLVRIIMGENMNRGEHIPHVADLPNRRAILDTMADIANRGVASGDFRTGIDVLQLHMTISALCFYYVANRFSFGQIFGVDMESPNMVATRRAEIVALVVGGCRARHG
ncbi:MAG: TetR/AcrR family transcriptional regulator [Sphingopyxis sp.]